jgi:hypothetical protein
MKPKEDPEDRKQRIRERRLSELELSKSAQENARGLSTDLFSVYGIGMGGGGGGGAPATTSTTPVASGPKSLFSSRPKLVQRERLSDR